MAVDWTALKLQYEIYEQTVEDLAIEFGVAPKMIEYAIEVQGWERRPVVNALKKFHSADRVDDLLLEQVDTYKRGLKTLKQLALSPKYVIAESAIINKITEMVAALPAHDPKSATALKSLAGVYKTLAEQNGLSADTQAQQEAAIGDRVVVNVLNKVPELGVEAKRVASTTTIPIDS